MIQEHCTEWLDLQNSDPHFLFLQKLMIAKGTTDITYKSL